MQLSQYGLDVARGTLKFFCLGPSLGGGSFRPLIKPREQRDECIRKAVQPRFIALSPLDIFEHMRARIVPSSVHDGPKRSHFKRRQATGLEWLERWFESRMRFRARCVLKRLLGQRYKEVGKDAHGVDSMWVIICG